jgi:predicted nucleic acid-binding protein
MSVSNGWLLDTNVLSELRRPRPDPNVVRFVETSPSETLFISTVTLAEIRFGIALIAEPEYRDGLSQWLENSVRLRFFQGTLPITEDILYRWRQLVEQGRKAGHTFSQPDLFLAATALQHNLTLVTRNTRDFAPIELPMLNPWTA